MTQDELIAKQALQIAELQETVADCKHRLRAIHRACVCMGGPLNDNVLGYTSKQLQPFRHIAEQAEI